MTAELVGPLVADGQPGQSGAWADYDNDGWLDLYVTNPGRSRSAGETGRKNLLYHNNGDGTFTSITSGSLANDVGSSTAGIWGDYDNDGFMDLFVANGDATPKQAACLYRNNGNTSGWLKLNLVGVLSNRSAIGARVRVKATIRSRSLWQVREISGGEGFFSQNDSRPNFGLGDATTAEIVRIEWPSGVIQELRDVRANRILTLVEPARLGTSITRDDGTVRLTIQSRKGFVYDVEASDDLRSWARLTTVTNETGALVIPDPAVGQAGRRFFRALGR